MAVLAAGPKVGLLAVTMSSLPDGDCLLALAIRLLVASKRAAAMGRLLSFADSLIATGLLRIAVIETHIQSSAELLLSPPTGIQH